MSQPPPKASGWEPPRLDGGIGRFLVLERPAADDPNSTLRAYDPILRREVALAVVALHESEVERRQELIAAAQSMARLSHPNILAVYDVVSLEQHVILATEHASGITLRRWLEQPRQWAEILTVFRDAGRALAAAHRVGVVHQNFSAASVLVSEEGRVLVTQFGADASPSDALSDQYDFCSALWDALSSDGARSSSQERASAHPRVPRGIFDAIARGLRPRVDERWPSMDALLDALEKHAARRRSPGRAAFALSALAVPGSWLWVWQSERGQRCGGAGDHLVGVWDDGRRQAVERALLATDVTYAADTWKRIETTLDEHAASWKRQYEGACRATVDEGVQPEAVLDLRMTCLHRRKVELRSLVDVLAEADYALVPKAVQMVESLPGLSRCADAEALAAEVPPPEDPSDAAIVDEARTLLAEADVLEQAGRYRQGLEKAQDATSMVAAVDYPPIHAVADFRQGFLLAQLGEYDAAEAALARALVSSLASAQYEIAVSAASTVAFITAAQQIRTGEGVWLADAAVALAQDAPEEVKANAHGCRGAVLYALSRNEDAEAEFREALGLREQVFGRDHPDTTQMRTNLAAALHVQGRYEEAEVEYRTLLVAQREILGAEHPSVAIVQNNLGLLLFEQGRYSEAETEYRAALVSQMRALRDSHPYIAETREHLAATLANMGRREEAQAEYEAAVEAFTRAFGEGHPRVVLAQERLRDSAQSV